MGIISIYFTSFFPDDSTAGWGDGDEVDSWRDGEEDEEGEREEWMEDKEEEPEEQRVPDDSGLPVIEESSIFSQSTLKTTIYGDKRSGLVY